MRTEAEIRQVLEAVEEADPDLTDDVMSMIVDTLRWVTHSDPCSAEDFIRDYVSDLR